MCADFCIKMAGLVLYSRIIKHLQVCSSFVRKQKIKMLVYEKRDGDILFLIHIAVLNTDLKLLNFSGKEHNLEGIVNEKRSGSRDNQAIYFSFHSS